MRIFMQIKTFQILLNHKKPMGRLRVMTKSNLLIIHHSKQQKLHKDKIRINKDLEKEKKKQ